MHGLLGHQNVLSSKIIAFQSLFLLDPIFQSDFLSNFIHDMMSYGPMIIWFSSLCLGSSSARIYAICRYLSPPHVPINRGTNICTSHNIF